MVSTRPSKRLPFGTITSLTLRSGPFVMAMTSSPTSEFTVSTVDSSFASRNVPAGSEADCAARNTHKLIFEITPMRVSESKLAQIIDDLGDRLSKIPRVQKVENARAEWLHHFFQLVEDI